MTILFQAPILYEEEEEEEEDKVSVLEKEEEEETTRNPPPSIPRREKNQDIKRHRCAFKAKQPFPETPLSQRKKAKGKT